MNHLKKTLVIGNGDTALQVARHLAAAGVAVITTDGRPGIQGSTPDPLSSTGTPGIEALPAARLERCEGFTGAFQVVLSANGQKMRYDVGSIVVAEAARRLSNHTVLGLQASPFVQSLSDFRRRLADVPDQKSAALDGRTVVFLNGLAQESTPVIAEEIMQTALELQNLPDMRAYVLTANLKVAGEGLEALYYRAKEAGVLFIKFATTRPRIDQTEDGRVTIIFTDEASGLTMRLHSDVTVVDEAILPSEELQRISRILDIDTDAAGFLQTENVHRWPVFTNRRGILAAGPARAILLPAEAMADAAAAAAAVLGPAYESKATPITARIQSGKCIRCLTCYRLCPYRSIHKAERITVVPEACEGCGICAAECPRYAITMGESGHPFEHQLGRFTAPAAIADFWFPAFCCSRSAARAAELAASLNLELPAGLKVVEVPCAGALSVRHILKALTGGAAGVLVLSCHPDNCHSERGNLFVRQRIALICEQLGRMGENPNRLQGYTLAANMPREFADTVQRFEQDLRQLKADSQRGNHDQ
jgi:coenzyme F420-reducing hydrogenase delta subunit/Pyruvate/2-oxoacid:ferredoxin oxidoreductase delta subunit